MAAAAHTETGLDLLFQSITGFFQIKDLGPISRYVSGRFYYKLLLILFTIMI